MTLTPQQRQRLADGDISSAPAEVPPPPKRNDPSIPTVYDPQWQFYVDLTPAQIAAYQAMPEWVTYCAAQPVPNWGGDPVATAEAVTTLQNQPWAVSAWSAPTLQTSLQTAQTAAQAVAVKASPVST